MEIESTKIICSGKNSDNYISDCQGVTEGIEKNIIYEIKDFNKVISKKVYAVCPINEKIIIAISHFKKDNKIRTTCMLNLEKVDLEKDKIEIDKYKMYYYKKHIFRIEATSDTWENIIVVTGEGINEWIFGETSADSPKDLQDKDFLDLLIKAKRFVDNKIING